MTKAKLRLSLQRDILSILIRDKDVIVRCRGVIKSQYFTTVPYRWLCKKVFKHYEKYDGSLLTKKSLLLDLRKDIKEVDELRAYKRALLPLYKIKVKSKKHIFDNIYSWAEVQSFGLLLRKAAKFGEQGNLEGAKDVIKSSFLFDIGKDDYEICDFTEDWDSRQEFRKLKKRDKKYKQIKLKLGPLDNVCQIFTGTSLLIVVAATSGIGKSIFSVHVGSSAFLSNVKVAHFVFENVIDQVVGRYDSRLLGYPYRNIMMYKWKKKDIKQARFHIKKLRSKFRKNLKIFHFPIDTCTVPKIEAVLRTLEIAEGWIPDIIIYDSLDHMLPSEKQENYRLNVSKVYKDAKKQSEIRRIPVFTTSHAKAGERHQLVRQEGFSESYDKARLSDIWLTISQTAEQEDSREAIIFLDKNRDDEGNLKLLVDLMFHVMSINFKEVVE